MPNGMPPVSPMPAGPSGPTTNPMQGMPAQGMPMQGMAGPQGAPMGGQPPAPMQPGPTAPGGQDTLEHVVDPQTLTIDRLLEETNIAEHLDDELLCKMGDKVWAGYKLDRDSKSNWDSNVDQWLKMASQVKERKTWPWQNASNVKYPLLSTAAMQFAARAYPSLVPSDGKLVHLKVVGIDPQGQKEDLAQKIEMHMNFQLTEDMPDWEEEMDKLLLQLPIIGCLFKKTYFDNIEKHSVSCLVGSKDLVVNYWARSLEDAYRVSEVLYMTRNDLATMMAAKIYCEIDLPDPINDGSSRPVVYDIHGNQRPSESDESTPYTLIEQHTYWDLDEDGYAEPYIITIEEQSKRVLRVVARWDSDGVHKDQDGNIIYIEPVGYYTKYEFLPNPDGSFYGIGFGHLLGPLNEAANTLMNQLIDAGTLSNLQSGFLGKGLRTKNGDSRFQPGEWKHVNATGDDLRKQVVPLPLGQPSSVLFQLLGMTVESTEKLASIAEIFVGKMPGQNTPATTTMATIEQGMKVFTAIYKRVYRSLTKEYKKLFRLNSLYQENIDRALHILDEPISVLDYDVKAYNVCPTADPTAVSSTQKLIKAQGLMELMQLGTIDPMEVTKRILDAQEQPNPEKLIRQSSPPPDPKTQQIQAETQAMQEQHQADMQMAQIKLAQEQLKTQQMNQGAAFDNYTQAMSAKLDQLTQLVNLMHKDAQNKLDMIHAQAGHVQALVHGEQKHAQSLQHKEEQHAQKLRTTGVAAQSGDSSSS